MDEERYEIPVGVRACAVVAFRDGEGGVDGEVVQEAENGLRVGPGDVMGFYEIVVWEAEAAGEAEH